LRYGLAVIDVTGRQCPYCSKNNLSEESVPGKRIGTG
jgi:hypothetical protein